MKITLESTDKKGFLNGVPARIWQGQTEAGIPVHCYITRISPQTHDPAALAAFDAELTLCRSPERDPGAIDFRFTGLDIL